jgi:uracil-DNA glycosylase family 4
VGLVPNYIAGIGPLEPELMIIGEAPGKHEDEQGKPFVGPSGSILDDCLYKAGAKRNECYITNVVKYRPPMNDFDQLHLIGVNPEEEAQKLWDEEIHQFRPKCILAVGARALRAVLGYPVLFNSKDDKLKITDYRGSILTAKDGVTKVVPTIHPAALFSRGDKGGLEYTYLKLIEHDIIRAVEESKTRSLNLPERDLTVARNSLDVYRFFRQYEGLTKAACDIESINCVPVCVGFAFNRHHAISIPLLRSVGKHQLTDMGENELDEVWREIDRQLRQLHLIGHNFKYDEFKLGLIGFECPYVISDTLIKTRVIFPELPTKRLNDVSSLWTREPFYKEEGKEFKLSKDSPDRLFKYNAKDCAVEWEVDEEQDIDLDSLSEQFKIPLRSYYYDYMMKKHKFYLKMENVGFLVDLNRKKELSKKYGEMAKVVHDRITSMVGYEVNVNSYPQMFNLLYKEMRFKYMKNNPTSEDTIVQLLGNHAKTKEKKDILTDLLEERRIRTQKSRYINFCPDYDGRCKSSFNISATETCRSSTSILKKPVRPKKIGLAFHTISKHGRLAKDIRSMFIPDRGYIILSADSSQAEARVVAVLSEDWELLNAFDKVDIHRRTAGLIFGYTKDLILAIKTIPVVDVLEKDGPERFCGKKTRHAGNYNMGKNRFMVEFNTDAQKFDINMSISEWRANQMLELFHAASPKIRNKFHQDIRDCLSSTRTIIDPFGGLRQFNGRMDEELFKEGYANIPQRTVAHLVQGAAIKIDEELNGDVEFKWLSEDHDSLKMLVPENNWELYAKLMKKYFEAPIDFKTYCSLKRNYTLVIPCEIEMSDTNYAEMRKVKLEEYTANNSNLVKG